MTVPLPNVAEALNSGGAPSVAWRNWFQAINARFQAGDLSTAELEAAIADIQAQLAELGGGNVAQGEGIAVYGSLADTLTIALRALADSGDGTLLAITRDEFGRVSGTKPVTAGAFVTITDIGASVEIDALASPQQYGRITADGDIRSTGADLRITD